MKPGLPETKLLTIAAREAWVELIPVTVAPLPAAAVYYRLVGGGRMLANGAYRLLLDHDAKTFTIEENADA